MDLERRAQALLTLVDDYRQRRGEELLAPAHADARAAVKSALGEARRRVRTAIDEARKRYGAQVGAAEAALATDRRLAAQRHAVRLLEAAWQSLHGRLLAEWRDADGRARWIEAHLQRALQSVPHAGGWHIEHAPDLGGAARARCDTLLHAAGVGATYAAQPAIEAGFRVINGHNVMDATLDGLLADRAALEGRLLHDLEASATTPNASPASPA